MFLSIFFNFHKIINFITIKIVIQPSHLCGYIAAGCHLLDPCFLVATDWVMLKQDICILTGVRVTRKRLVSELCALRPPGWSKEPSV